MNSRNNLSIKRILDGIRKGRIADEVFSAIFPLCQSMGFHITKNHYYQPVPDTRTLKDELWQRHSEMIGIDMNEDGQLELLGEFSAKFKQEYDKIPLNEDQISNSYDYYIKNGSFESVDGEVLYSMIRHFKPKNIIEIGSGNSTFLSAQAVLKNKEEAGIDCQLVAVEPHPCAALKAGFPGLSKLEQVKIQDVPLVNFRLLAEDDILFIDSSHVLKIGSDVQFEFLEILPRLNSGVVVHVHDIFLPAEFPKEWVLGRKRFWTEQYLLQAFLSFNSAFEILWAGSYMHLKHADKLESAFASFSRKDTWPGSFWMRKIR